jgi:hypothetical protein
MLRHIGLMLALGAAAPGADFWKSKPPQQWSKEETERMRYDSPWAREAKTSWALKTQRPPGPDMIPIPGGPQQSRADQMGLPPGVSGRTPNVPVIGAGVEDLPLPRVWVRWESAAPVRASLKKMGADTGLHARVEAGAGAHYVIAAAGMPLDVKSSGETRPNPEKMRRAAERLKDTARLRFGKNAALKPVEVELLSSPEGLTATFLFDRGATSGKEAKFQVSYGLLEVEAEFKLKSMAWQGKPEL